MYTPKLAKVRLLGSCLAIAVSLLFGCGPSEQLPSELKEQLSKSPKELAERAAAKPVELTNTSSVDGDAKSANSIGSPAAKISNLADDKKTDTTQPSESVPIVSDINDTPWIDDKSLPWSYAEAHYVGSIRIGFAMLRIESTELTNQLRIVREDTIDRAADGSAVPIRRFLLELHELVNGQLSYFKFESSIDGDNDLTIEGRRAGSELAITKRVQDQEVPNNRKTESTKIPWNPQFWGPLGVQQILMRKPMIAGEKRTSNIFIPQLSLYLPVRLEANRPELTPLATGQTASLTQVNLTIGSQESASYSSLFVDHQGVIQKTITRTGDQIVLKLRIDENVARRLADQTQFSRWSVKTLKLTGDPAALATSSTVTYLVEAELGNTDPYNAILPSMRQRLRSRSATSCEVRVSPNPGRASVAANESEADRQPTDVELSPTVMIPSDKQPIIDLANEILGDATNQQLPPQELVELLRAGVHQRVNLKKETNDISSTLVAARERSANHIELAHLFASVLRNQNIPSRMASGLYYDPTVQAFVFHTWNQAWIEDRWIDLDASNPSNVMSGYITMAVNSGEDENPFAHYLAALSPINKLSGITLLSAER